jgi:hypothetical protein
MRPHGEQSDEQLLLSAATDEDSLGTSYVRYEHRVIAFFMRAVGRGDLAAELTAETFAALSSLRSAMTLRLARPTGGCSASHETCWRVSVRGSIRTRHDRL